MIRNNSGTNAFTSSDLDSGVSLNLRSHVSGSRGRTRQLPMMTRQQSAPEPETQSSAAAAMKHVLDDTDNHSSEEELEDIIGDKKKVYTSGAVAAGGGKGNVSIKSGVGARCSSTNPEKRKWSEVNTSEDEKSVSSQCVFRAGSGSSGDEEVSGLLDGAGASYTPVQFCTSPPLDVCRPRKSQSPPPKLFHMSSSNGQGSSGGPCRQHSLDSAGKGRDGGQRPSGAFLPRPRPRLLRPVEFSSLSFNGRQEATGDTGGDEGDEISGSVDENGHRSPNKRHRTTPRPQNIQRPCLDFEKMQQVRYFTISTSRIMIVKLDFHFRLKQKLLHHGDRARSFLYFVGKIPEQYYPPLLVFILNFTTCIISSLSSGDILGILQLKYTRNNWTDFVPLTLK